MNVYAFDGSQITLPASEMIKNEFDPHSCVLGKPRGYYPQALATVVYDVMRAIPVARSLEKSRASERDTALTLLPQLKKGDLTLWDRGYPSYEMIYSIEHIHSMKYVMRCKGRNSFKEVETFIRSGKEEQILHIKLMKNRLKHIKINKNELPVLVVRAIRYVDKKGNVSVLLPNLLDMQQYSLNQLSQLYRDRWEIEINYSHEKQEMKFEKFHSKSPNGILQEFYAVGILSVITRLLSSSVYDKPHSAQHKQQQAPQYKNAFKAVCADVALFIANNTSKALKFFSQLLHEIKRVSYRRPKKKEKTILAYQKRLKINGLMNEANF
jgi:hypothetical protein